MAADAVKHPAAGILTPLCALCGDEEGRCHGEAEEDMPGSFQTGAHSGTSWKNQSFASRALLPALDGRWRGYTVPRRASLERRSKPVYCSHLRRPIGLRMAGRVVGWELVANAGSTWSFGSRGHQPSMSPTAASWSWASANPEEPPPWRS